jgi:hypothetical protein
VRTQLKAIAKQLRQINESDDLTSAPYLLRQARQVALDHGNGAAAKLARCGEYCTVMEARELIASMIGLCSAPTRSTLSVKQAAQSIAVSQDTIRAFILSGELKASNVGSGKSKGRYIIQMNDWQQFLDNRKPDPPAKRRRLNSAFKRY